MLKTIEAQTGNGNGCGGENSTNRKVEEIFRAFGAALPGIAAEVGAKALTRVDKKIISQIPPEQALAFAEAVAAKNMVDAFAAGARRLQGLLTNPLLATVGTAQQETLRELYRYYEDIGEHTMTPIAQALREQLAESN